MKKYFAVVIVFIVSIFCVLVFSGCSGEEIDIALVTSLDTDDIGTVAADCIEGITAYSEANNVSYKIYKGNCGEKIKEAEDDGADVIVIVGVDDESAVYSNANANPDTKFICVDFGSNFVVRSNIYCINAIHTQAGVYAGYSAVKEGNITLGIQGESTAETYNYIRGFVEGAQIAAVEIGVKKNPVNIYYNVSGTDMIDVRTESWINNGCKVIFCSDATYSLAAECITDTDICSIMTFGADRTEHEKVAASAHGNYSDLLEEILKDAFNGNFKGGLIDSFGAGDGVSAFSYNPGFFDVVTASDLDNITADLSASDISDFYVYSEPSDKGYNKIVLSQKGIIYNQENQ